MAIRLVVDSGTDLLKNVAQERNIEIVPLKVPLVPNPSPTGSTLTTIPSMRK